MPRRSPSGFTLAELLITLAILGVIATFTIPKILLTQQNKNYNALAKETMGTLSEGLSQYKKNNIITSNTRGYPVSFLSSIHANPKYQYCL